MKFKWKSKTTNDRENTTSNTDFSDCLYDSLKIKCNDYKNLFLSCYLHNNNSKNNNNNCTKKWTNVRAMKNPCEVNKYVEESYLFNLSSIESNMSCKPKKLILIFLSKKNSFYFIATRQLGTGKKWRNNLPSKSLRDKHSLLRFFKNENFF